MTKDTNVSSTCVKRVEPHQEDCNVAPTMEQCKCQRSQTTPCPKRPISQVSHLVEHGTMRGHSEASSIIERLTRLNHRIVNQKGLFCATLLTALAKSGLQSRWKTLVGDRNTYKLNPHLHYGSPLIDPFAKPQWDQNLMTLEHKCLPWPKWRCDVWHQSQGFVHVRQNLWREEFQHFQSTSADAKHQRVLGTSRKIVQNKYKSKKGPIWTNEVSKQNF